MGFSVVLSGVDRAGAERESIGDGVEAAVTEGIAAKQPPSGQEKTPGHPEAFDGLHRVR